MKNLLINRLIVSLIEPPLNIFFRLFFVLQQNTCIMMVQLAVMDSYAEHFVIFVYVLMDHLVVKTRLVVKTHLLQLCKKIKFIYIILYIIM